MSEPVYATVDGIEFVLCQCEGATDMWMPSAGDWDGPTDPRPLSQWRKAVAQWHVEKQKAAGFKAWDVRNDNPEFWRLGDAVFRKGIPTADPKYRMGTHEVLFRNGNPDDPKSLYYVMRGYTAMNTPEARAAIEAARDAYAKAVAATDAWKKARAAIPVMPEAELLKLTPKPEKM